MIQIIEFRENECDVILKAVLNMDDLDFARQRIQVQLLAKDLGAEHVAITVKNDDGKCYFIGNYNI